MQGGQGVEERCERGERMEVDEKGRCLAYATRLMISQTYHQIWSKSVKKSGDMNCNRAETK